MAGTGFFKGEKKKPKKGKTQHFGTTSQAMGAPTFRLPELISKKDKNQ